MNATDTKATQIQSKGVEPTTLRPPTQQPVTRQQPPSGIVRLQAGVGNAALAAAASNGSLGSSAPLLPVQSSYGNAAASRSLQPKRTSVNKAASPPFDTGTSLQRQPAKRGIMVQPKLTVGAAHDPYEQEADRVAQQVMRMPPPPSAATGQASVQQQTLEGNEVAQTKPLAATITPLAQRSPSDSTGSFEPGADFESRLGASGGGSPLPASTRAFMEPRFGADFSEVRLHTGSEAAQLNRAVGAQAFTHGPDIYLGGGKDDLESSAGKQLLAHELTHTIQQGAAAFSNGRFDPATSSGRRLLAHKLTDVVQQRTLHQGGAASGSTVIQRDADSDDYKQGYQDGLSGGESHALPRYGDALTDYNEGYAKGHYEFSQQTSSVNAPGPAETQTPATAPAAPSPAEVTPATSTASVPAASPANVTPTYSKKTWQQLLPRAHGAKDARITKIDLHTPGNKIDTWGTGDAPTLNYVPDKDIHTDPASAAPQGGIGGTPEADALAAEDSLRLSAAQDAAISQIIAARAKIPDRPMGRSRNNNAGYDYNPDNDPAAKDYNQWIKSALPTGVNASDWNWQVFKRIQELEGQEGRFTTFDKTLSVGPGYSTSGGQTQKVIGKTFNLLPEVKLVAFAAGLTVDADGGMTVVDTDKKWILDSQDAAAYVQTDVSLLSLLVNVSQGVQPVDASGGAVAPDEQGKQRQALLDAEWQQFLSGTLAGLPSLVQSWPLDSAVLAVHAKHARPSLLPFSFWNAQNGPDLATMVAAIYNAVGESAKYICSDKYAKFHGSP